MKISLGFWGFILVVGVLAYLLAMILTSNQVGYGSQGLPTKIVFEESQIATLNLVFAENPLSEQVYCLKGEIIDGTAYVREMTHQASTPMSQPDGSIGVSAEPCKNTFLKNDLLGMIHNHPNGVCRLGEYDLYAFGNSRVKTMGVICGFDAVFVWTPNNVLESIPVQIGDGGIRPTI